jgi:hypothetical protein
MDLEGDIPKELGKLTTLEVLDLTFNDLLGGPFPEELCQLSNLNSLFLGYTQLSGELPGCIGDLFKLTSLFVSTVLDYHTCIMIWLYSLGLCSSRFPVILFVHISL